MKNILLWDPRFPDRSPTRHFVDDVIAAAIVRSGVGAIADPNEPGVFPGGALDPGELVEVVVQVGLFKATTRLLLPLSVVELIVQTGLGSAIGGEVVPSPEVPISITGPASVDATIGVPFSQAWGIEGGTAPFELSIIAGSLPAWAEASIAGRTITIEGMPA